MQIPDTDVEHVKNYARIVSSENLSLPRLGITFEMFLFTAVDFVFFARDLFLV